MTDDTQTSAPLRCQIFGHRYRDTPVPGPGSPSRGICQRCGRETDGYRVNDWLGLYRHFAETHEPDVAQTLIRNAAITRRLND